MICVFRGVNYVFRAMNRGLRCENCLNRDDDVCLHGHLLYSNICRAHQLHY